MPLSKDSTFAVVHNILQKYSVEEVLSKLTARNPDEYPLPRNLAKQTELTSQAQKTRIDILQSNGASLKHLAGHSKIDDRLHGRMPTAYAVEFLYSVSLQLFIPVAVFVVAIDLRCGIRDVPELGNIDRESCLSAE